MFYRTIIINSDQYPLAVNIAGHGEPDENTEADEAMIYMDLDTEKMYKRTPSGWVEIADKAYVDSLVGDIDAALAEIIAIEDELISRGINIELSDLGEVTPPDEQ